MEKFSYKITDRSGQPKNGLIEGNNLADALRKLRRDGNYVLTIEPAIATTSDDDVPLIPRRITRKDIIGFTSELAVMVDTGITLSVAMANIIEQTENPSMVRVLRSLKGAVEAGEDFSTALGRYPKYFDKTYIQLVKASEASGSLGAMLDRIVTQGRRDMESQGKVRSALAYPAVMLVASVAASVFLLTYVFPKFTPIFTGKGITLPVPTRIMIAISDSLIGYWYLYCLGGLVLIAFLFWFFKSAAGRTLADNLKLNMPILGPMFRKAAVSRSIRTLSTMLASGVPMLQAIRLSGQVSGNIFYEEDWNTIAQAISEGEQIHQRMATLSRFPKTLVRMIAAGEQTGKLSTMLTKVSEFYDRELENAIKAVTTLIEPIMVCVMGFVIGSIAMALMLPIFTLSRHVG
jgi:type IV pilus assembly protein PilC